MCALADFIAIYVVADVIAMSYVVDHITTEADGITSCLASLQMLLTFDFVLGGKW